MEPTRVTAPHLQRGRQAEQAAEGWLRERGLQTLARNYRSPFGEIDLIMRDGSSVVFVEVRSRRRRRPVGAAESIDSAKCARLAATAEHFLQRNRALATSACRFDVVTIEGEPARLTWLRDAFQAD